MAIYVSKTSGNFSSTGTWELVDGTSVLLSATGSTLVTTSYVASTSFTPGAITVTGVGLFLGIRIASPTGTFDVQLYNVTLAAQTNLVTVNVSDLPVIPSLNIVHTYFRFSSPSILSSTQSYQIRLKTSSSSQITCFRDATVGNWSRFITTSTTGNPTASDGLYVVGQYTGQGASSSVTVIMDNNLSTQYGPLVVGSKGTLDWSTQSTTQLWIGGDIYQPTGTGALTSLLVSDGLFQMGSSMSRIADGVTASLYINSTLTNSNRILTNQNGIFRAAGKTFSNSWTTLTSDLSASGTTASVASTTGWSVNDEIVIAPTSRTPTQFDRRGLSSISGTTIGFTASTFAHSGTGNFAGEVINLTRNCKILSVSSTTRTYMITNNISSTIDIDSVEFVQFGTTLGAVYLNGNFTSPYFVTIKNSSFRDGGAAITFTTTQYYSNSIIDNNVYHSNNSTTPYAFIYGSAPAGTGTSTNSYISNNVMVYNVGVSGIAAIYIPNCIIDMENNRVSGYPQTAGGIFYGAASYYFKTGKFNNNVVRASTNGILVSAIDTLDTGYHQTGNKSIRNGNYGFYLIGTVNSRLNDIVAIGNTTANILVAYNVQSQSDNLFINNANVQGETSFSCPYGLYFTGTITSTPYQANVTFNNCTFGSHSTSDIRFNAQVNNLCNLVLNNCYFTSAIEVSQPSFMSKGSKVSIQRANGTNGAHRTYFRDGLLTLDTTIYRSSTKSVRLAPTSATYFQSFGNKVIPVKASSTPTISVWVRKSATSAGDSSSYNGSQPRLWLRQNSALASFSTYDDIALATASAANGTWEQLSATLPVTPYEDTAFEVYVDCNGTTGWVNIDDWRVSQ